MEQDTASEPQFSTGRTILTLAVKVIVSVVLLWLLFRRTDVERLWVQARSASLMWLAVALGLYFVMILASVWRWGQLLSAQHVSVPRTKLVASYLVATFFNNFLPSNIGGDVVRIRDTVGPARSRMLATIIVLIDRALGLIGLLAVAAVGSTVALALGTGGAMPVRPLLIWAGLAMMLGSFVTAVVAPTLVTRLFHPLRLVHRQWIDARLERLTVALGKFRASPGALFNGFVGAVIVQAVLVGFYAAIASSLHIPISSAHLAVLVPVSFLVQMLPVSVNGFGVREATFSYYFLRLRLPIESALVLSLLGAGLTLLFSISGAIVYSTRR
jgi:uncharacterized membrane protein YbhN (UPF0104 family)